MIGNFFTELEIILRGYIQNKDEDSPKTPDEKRYFAAKELKSFYMDGISPNNLRSILDNLVVLSKSLNSTCKDEAMEYLISQLSLAILKSDPKTLIYWIKQKPELLKLLKKYSFSDISKSTFLFARMMKLE